MPWTLEETISFYKRQGAPGDQNALVNLLKEVQSESGGSVPAYALEVIAPALGVKPSFLEAVIRRYPSLRLGDTHFLEICGGANCGKRGELADWAMNHRAKNIVLKIVPCMRQCGKGPNIRWDGKLYNGADAELLRSLTETLGQGRGYTE